MDVLAAGLQTGGRHPWQQQRAEFLFRSRLGADQSDDGDRSGVGTHGCCGATFRQSRPGDKPGVVLPLPGWQRPGGRLNPQVNLKSRLALVFFVAGLLLAGCATQPDFIVSTPAFPESLAPLANTDLKCIRLVADGKSVAVPADSPLTLRLETEVDKTVKVSGQSAVNRYFGSFTLGATGPGQIS